MNVGSKRGKQKVHLRSKKDGKKENREKINGRKRAPEAEKYID